MIFNKAKDALKASQTKFGLMFVILTSTFFLGIHAVKAVDPNRLSGAIFTTTPDGSIVNENVRYESKEQVFLDGGPGLNAPRSAAALPAGYYYFQVTDPSGKCLLSSIFEDAGVNGGTCFESVKGRGGPKNAQTFSAEPLSCRLFYFDGEDGITLMNSTYTVTEKVKGQMVERSYPCQHKLGTEYIAENGGSGTPPDGETLQLFPYANTPNPGGVYKAWVSAAHSVHSACGVADMDAMNSSGETGEGCNGFFGFIPRWSKTDNYKADHFNPPQGFDVGILKYHDANLNCQFDDLDQYYNDQYIAGWEIGVIEPNGGDGEEQIYMTSNDENMPLAFSVLDKEHLAWSTHEYRWANTPTTPLALTALNTGSTHITTYADLLDVSRTIIEKEGVGIFASVNACTTNIQNYVTRLATEQTPDFVPGDYAQAIDGADNPPQLYVRFGNVGFDDITVCKVYSADKGGTLSGNEPIIEGWPITLTVPKTVPLPDISDTAAKITAKFGGSVDVDIVDGSLTVTKYTDTSGCVTFNGLLPNAYKDDLNNLNPIIAVASGEESQYVISEAMPSGWYSGGPTSYNFDVISTASGGNIAGALVNLNVGQMTPPSGADAAFGNYCKVTVDFDTKGYWHNNNGQAELTQADIDYANSKLPYSSPSAYFDAGDEPFDSKLEVSLFLIDDNGNADLNGHQEQLAQQLLAFIFNVRHRASMDAQTHFDGTLMTFSEIIDSSIVIWASGSSAERVTRQELLNSFNENNAVELVPDQALCEQLYPVNNN
ncbi:hypothetical protein E2K93_03395 [Thalassotalea sp. HSM 43]|uniref:hypothetical protein n=1 Tax=Thalassotalea sp. HSM 43 TaxID=2552945 RepID=UPI001080A741|nr:hypothetical protein [Thalassotalea sp. HSM 43]QBY03477.1 hypothetical protein E2K93_03395 [Thalassotalea sp. HSM 43]